MPRIRHMRVEFQTDDVVGLDVMHRELRQMFRNPDVVSVEIEGMRRVPMTVRKLSDPDDIPSEGVSFSHVEWTGFLWFDWPK